MRSAFALGFGALLTFGATGLMACDGAIDSVDPPLPEREVPAYEAQPGRLRRLTANQYRRAVTDVFGELTLPSTLEADERESGLVAIGNAGGGGVTPRGAELYEDAAYLIAEQVMAQDVLGCDAGSFDATCAETYLRTVGRRLWRRPLSAQEITELVAVARNATDVLGEFRAGMRFALAGLLQSPHFLFRTERSDGMQEGVNERLSAWDLASRLSYFLWDAAPDEALLDAAARGDLHSPQGYARQVERMLADGRTHDGVRAIFDDMLGLEALRSLRKDPQAFPHMSPEVGPAAREETLRTIEWLTFDEPAPYVDLFTTQTTFINPKLASIYGVRAPSRDDFGRYEHAPNTERSGLLGHISMLALHSHVGSSSATLRGIFVRRTLLCDEIPPPPADVDTSIPEPIPGAATLRERVRRHLEDPSCAGCHGRMDPLGLGLENFDAIGRFRTHDNGARIDPSGDLDGRVFRSPTEMGRALAEAPVTTECAVRTFYRIAHGRKENAREEQAIQSIHEAFEAADYHILSLMRAVVMDGSFQLVGPRDLADEPGEGEEVQP